MSVKRIRSTSPVWLSMIGEFAYYGSLGEWLVSQGYDIGRGLGLPRDSYEERGSPFRPDKVGIGNLDTKDVEIVSVEIKQAKIDYEVIDQASRYFIFSHKVYIASPYQATNRYAQDLPELYQNKFFFRQGLKCAG